MCLFNYTWMIPFSSPAHPFDAAAQIFPLCSGETGPCQNPLIWWWPLCRHESSPSPHLSGGEEGVLLRGWGRHVSTGGRPSAAAGVCWLRAPQHGCALSPLYGHDYVDLLAIVGTWWVRSYFDGSLWMLYVERNASRRNKTANVERIKTFKTTRRTSAVRKIMCTLLVTTNIVLLGPSVQKGALYDTAWPNDRPG